MTGCPRSTTCGSIENRLTTGAPGSAVSVGATVGSAVGAAIAAASVGSAVEAAIAAAAVGSPVGTAVAATAAALPLIDGITRLTITAKNSSSASASGSQTGISARWTNCAVADSE